MRYLILALMLSGCGAFPPPEPMFTAAYLRAAVNTKHLTQASYLVEGELK